MSSFKITNLLKQTTKREIDWFINACGVPKVRTIREFAEQEIVLPTGPHAGKKFRCYRQPFSRLWFDELNSKTWRRYIATGPMQSGKSLMCLVIPMMYCLFELGETCILGAPSAVIASDKWVRDIRPVIMCSRYADMLPKGGAGSKGGKNIDTIVFRNGAVLKVMTAGGGDKSRASFTSKYVFITETDGMDEAGEQSRESDPITQIEGRTRAYGSAARIIMECTVSTEDGRTWKEYMENTQSRIVRPCPHCHEWVTPERDNLMGWQHAQTKLEAEKSSTWVCPNKDCRKVITSQQRTEMNHKSRLIHKGQEVMPDGTQIGEAPETDTLAFRWSAFDNLLADASFIAGEEWKCSRDPDEDNAELKMRQQFWCLPAESKKESDVDLNIVTLCERTKKGIHRGAVPRGFPIITVGVDVGKNQGHFVTIAWGENATAHILDYDAFAIESNSFGVEQAIYMALRNMSQEVWEVGWKDEDGRTIQPMQVWIDSGYKPEPIYKFTAEHKNRRYLATKGFGSSADLDAHYSQRKGEYAGRGYQPGQDFVGMAVDADHWKTFVHTRLNTPVGLPGAMTLYDTSAFNHRGFAHHILAERCFVEYVPKRGNVTKWERVAKDNHKFDCTAYAAAAAHYCGVRLLDPNAQERVQSRPKPRMPLLTDDGRPFLITER